MMITPHSPIELLEEHVRSRLHPLSGHDESHHKPHTDPDPNAPEGVAPTRTYRPAAVLAPLVLRPEGLNVILTRRSDELRSHSGQVAFPGGRAEAGETPAQTALREAHEEIGLEPGFVRLAGLGDRYDSGSGYSITPVVGFVTPGFTLNPDPGEVAEVFETPFSFLMDPANHERRIWRQPNGSDRHYYAMPHEGRLIWGVTAGMLRALYERLFGDQD